MMPESSQGKIYSALGVLKPLCIQRGMPLLTYESDGYAVSPSVLRQVDVHIQQVLEHASGKHEAA